MGTFQARKLLKEAIANVIERRRKEVDDDNNSSKSSRGLLGVLLGAKDHNLLHYSDSQITDNIIGVIFAAHDTTASALTWVLKYLHDNKDVLQAVTVYILIYILLP